MMGAAVNAAMRRIDLLVDFCLVGALATVLAVVIFVAWNPVFAVHLPAVGKFANRVLFQRVDALEVRR